MSCLTLTPPRYDDDARLVAGMIADCRDAWRTFHRRYGDVIQQSIQRITRRFWRIATVADAQDVFGAFYLSLVANDKRKLRSFDPARGYRLSSWIRVLATHSTYDWLRRVSREPAKEELEAAANVPCKSMDACQRLVRHEEVTALSRQLERFSPRDRAFVELHMRGDADAQTVASRMRISIKTVYSKKNKIVTRLSSALSPKD